MTAAADGRAADVRRAISSRTLAAILTPIGLLVAWDLATRGGLVDPRFLPRPSAVAAMAAKLVESGDLWLGLRASLLRNLAGFAVGATAGIVGGVVLGISRTTDRAFHPTLGALKQVSPFALLPLLSFWLGIGEPAKIGFVALTCVYPVLVNTQEGVRSVPEKLREVGAVFRLTRWQLVSRIVLPSAVPSIFTGLRLGMAFSWLGTVGAEYFLSAGPGVGNLILDGRTGFRMDLLFVGIGVIGTTGFALSAVVALVERRILRWRPAAR